MTHYAAEYGCEDPRDQHYCKELCPHTNVGTHAGKNCLRLNKQYEETKPDVYAASTRYHVSTASRKTCLKLPTTGLI